MLHRSNRDHRRCGVCASFKCVPHRLDGASHQQSSVGPPLLLRLGSIASGRNSAERLGMVAGARSDRADVCVMLQVNQNHAFSSSLSYSSSDAHHNIIHIDTRDGMQHEYHKAEVLFLPIHPHAFAE